MWRKSPTYQAEEILHLVRAMRPGSDPVAADHDDMAALCQGEAWFVFFDTEESEPERIIFELKKGE